ncbi:MAG: hypothetical protein ACK40G_16235 [Cytophagaceae bacterium]
MRPIFGAIIFILLFACAEKRPHNEKDIFLEQPEDLEPTSDTLTINNNSEYKVKVLLDLHKYEFENPDSDFYYFIGESKISFVNEDAGYFNIPGKKLIIDKDTIIFKTTQGASVTGVFPTAFINYLYPDKYERISNIYQSKNFGRIELKDKGFSCDDSFSGEVRIGDNSDLVISGLANIDLFENEGEIFILSYHNCLMPSLKVIKVEK